ncbi:MAG TPA: ZIP family metal transporter [Candidatus Peribacteria bacterium]|nr:ZIP family metal transporter [Candidatus Peribacteria bacterium]
MSTLSHLPPSILAILSVVGVSLLSLLGVAFFFVEEKLMKRVLLYIVSFSTGALLGDVFIHILPEMAESDPASFPKGMLIILAGMLFSFIIEKFVHWRHCHVLPDVECCGGGHKHESHHHPVGMLSAIGESMHNFIDGIVIAAAFLASVPVGVSTALAVMIHEIPHEIGNVAVLLHSGYGKRKAVLLNMLSASASIVGALGVIAASGAFSHAATYILPFAAGNLLYIAGSDLIPELHKETRLKQGVLQLLCIAGGILMMYLLLALE